MNRKVLVKKIWSLNPIKFKKITLKQASDEYLVYINMDTANYKSFIEWLESEI